MEANGAGDRWSVPSLAWEAPLSGIHGSSLLTLGETQVLATATVAPLKEHYQRNHTDEPWKGEQKALIVNHSVPGFSKSLAKRLAHSGAEEVAVGRLMERALALVVPSELATVRVTSQVVTGSNVCMI